MNAGVKIRVGKIQPKRNKAAPEKAKKHATPRSQPIFSFKIMAEISIDDLVKSFGTQPTTEQDIASIISNLGGQAGGLAGRRHQTRGLG